MRREKSFPSIDIFQRFFRERRKLNLGGKFLYSRAKTDDCEINQFETPGLYREVAFQGINRNTCHTKRQEFVVLSMANAFLATFGKGD